MVLEKAYLNGQKKKELLIYSGVLILLFLAYVFSTIGMDDVETKQLLIAIKKYFDGTLETSDDAVANKIILLLRLPRIILAILAGVGLSFSGAVMQSVTRNYLVSPFTLGISAAAAFGASTCIVWGQGEFLQSNAGIVTSAFIVSCACGLLVYGIAKQMGLRPVTIVLVGIGLNYLFSALTASVEFFAKEYKLAAIVQWSFGTFNKATWSNVALVVMVVGVCFVAMLCFSQALNVMATNDDESAKSLGINTNKIRIISGLLSILATSAIISFTGVIGFVGLIAPHIARLIIGNDHKYYLPFAAITGSVLLLLSDTLGRFLLYPVTLPVGIVISFVGVPVFINLIYRNRKK